MLNFIKENLFLFFIIFIIVVAPSFFVGALQVFAIIILALLLILIIGALIIRRRFKRVINSQQQGFNAEQGGQQRGQQGYRQYQDDKIKVKIFRTEGGTADNHSATDKKVSDKVGDYVDFEEIKE